MPSSEPAPSRDRRASVLVVGEALVDVVESQGGDERRAIPGGSAANVALGLARLGVAVRLATHLGRDPYGNLVARFLCGEGVEVDDSSFGADRTSTAVARPGPDGDVDYEFDVGWLMPAVDLAGAREATHVGSFAAFSTPEPVLTDMLGAARGHVLLSCDPNVRPALIADRAAAQARFRRLVRVLDVVKLSDADAEYLFPGNSPDAVADVLLGAGVGLVVVTRAQDGLLLADRTDRVRVPAVPATVIDTIGAGDTVMASVLADVARGRDLTDLESVGRRAAAAAAITVSRAGADLPRAGELAASHGVETFARAPRDA